jgi:hypothetical protein
MARTVGRGLAALAGFDAHWEAFALVRTASDRLAIAMGPRKLFSEPQKQPVWKFTMGNIAWAHALR